MASVSTHRVGSAAYYSAAFAAWPFLQAAMSGAPPPLCLLSEGHCLGADGGVTEACGTAESAARKSPWFSTPASRCGRWEPRRGRGPGCPHLPLGPNPSRASGGVQPSTPQTAALTLGSRSQPGTTRLE